MRAAPEIGTSTGGLTLGIFGDVLKIGGIAP